MSHTYPTLSNTVRLPDLPLDAPASYFEDLASEYAEEQAEAFEAAITELVEAAGSLSVEERHRRAEALALAYGRNVLATLCAVADRCEEAGAC